MGTICVLMRNTLAHNARPIPHSFYSTRGTAPGLAMEAGPKTPVAGLQEYDTLTFSPVDRLKEQLEEEVENWGSMSAMINRVLRTS